MKAFYSEQPAVFEPVGNGSFLYRYNIHEETVESGEHSAEEPATRSQWACEEVIVWERSSNAITKAVIADRWPSDYEQKLINEYNATKLGVIANHTEEAIDAVAKYMDFLSFRKLLKAQVDADCEELGIK